MSKVMMVMDQYTYPGYWNESTCRILVAEGSNNEFFVCAVNGEGTSITNAAESLWKKVRREIVPHFNAWSCTFLEFYPGNDYVDEVLYDPISDSVKWARFDFETFTELFGGVL